MLVTIPHRGEVLVWSIILRHTQNDFVSAPTVLTDHGEYNLIRHLLKVKLEVLLRAYRQSICSGRCPLYDYQLYVDSTAMPMISVRCGSRSHNIASGSLGSFFLGIFFPSSLTIPTCLLFECKSNPAYNPHKAPPRVDWLLSFKSVSEIFRFRYTELTFS